MPEQASPTSPGGASEQTSFRQICPGAHGVPPAQLPSFGANALQVPASPLPFGEQYAPSTQIG